MHDCLCTVIVEVVAVVKVMPASPREEKFLSKGTYDDDVHKGYFYWSLTFQGKCAS